VTLRVDARWPELVRFIHVATRGGAAGPGGAVGKGGDGHPRGDDGDAGPAGFPGPDGETVIVATDVAADFASLGL
jgi:hypothetical protein